MFFLRKIIIDLTLMKLRETVCVIKLSQRITLSLTYCSVLFCSLSCFWNNFETLKCLL